MNISPSKDTYLREDMPNHIVLPIHIFVGNYTDGRRFTGILNFSLPPAPNPAAEIIKIYLHLFYYGQATSGDDIIEAHELLEDFSEENATWSDRDIAVDWNTPGAMPPNSSSPDVLASVSVNATHNVWKILTLKEDAASGVNWNWGETHGIMLTAQGGDLFYKFVSKDATASDPFTNANKYKPYLEIVYTPIGPTPIASFIHSGERCV